MYLFYFLSRAQRLLMKYLYSKDPAEVITLKPKFDGGLNYLDKAGASVDEDAFRVGATYLSSQRQRSDA